MIRLVSSISYITSKLLNLVNDAHWDRTAGLFRFSIQQLELSVDNHILRVDGVHIDLIGPRSLLASFERTLFSSHVFAAVSIKAWPGDGSGAEDSIDSSCYLRNVVVRGHRDRDREFATRL